MLAPKCYRVLRRGKSIISAEKTYILKGTNIGQYLQLKYLAFSGNADVEGQ